MVITKGQISSVTEAVSGYLDLVEKLASRVTQLETELTNKGAQFGDIKDARDTARRWIYQRVDKVADAA